MTTVDTAWETSSIDASLADWVRQGLVVAATVLVLVVNALANTLPINGQTTGDISDRFDILFVPAGYVFSIWGLIYLLLVGYTVYHTLPSQRTSTLMRRTGYLYVLSCLANSGWIFLWHYNYFALTVVVMLALLLVLILLYRTTAKYAHTGMEQWLVQLPFSVYLGWITVATVANVTAYLDYVGWNAWGVDAQIWFGILLLVASGLGLLFGWRFRDWAYASVLVWAFAGIAVKQSDVPFVAGAAIAMAVALALVVGLVLVRRGIVLQPELPGESP